MERETTQANGDGGEAVAVVEDRPPAEKSRDEGNDVGKKDPVNESQAENESSHKSPADGAAKSERQAARLHVGRLTRNVTEEHLRAIFSVWGPLKTVEIAMDRAVHLPKGYAYVEFEKRQDADNALDHMNGGQIDGNIVDVKLVQATRKREPSPTPVPVRRPEPNPPPRSEPRPYEGGRPRSPLRYRRRSPPGRYSRSPPRRRSPYRHRSRTPPPRRTYAYENRGTSPRRRRSPYRGRRRSPSPRYRRREPARSPPSKRSRRSSSMSSSSSSMSSSGSSSVSSSS